MKKALSAVLFLLVSVSSFADQKVTTIVTQDQMEPYLSKYLSAGTRIGNCSITRSEVDQDSKTKGYILEIDTGAQDIAFLLNDGGEVSTLESENSNSLIIVPATNASRKKGLITSQKLTFTESIIETDKGQEKAIELSIETSTKKEKGLFRSSKTNKMKCGLSIII